MYNLPASKKLKSFITFSLLLAGMNIAAQTTGTFTDARDGKVYKTIQIGTQVWMAENLAYKTEYGSWAYANDEKNVAIYGYLYQWRMAEKVCPKGWHLPSEAEWKLLIDKLGGIENAGSKLRTPLGWTADKNSTNSSGFTALPGGARHARGSFFSVGRLGSWWGAEYKDGDEDMLDKARSYWLYSFGYQLSWSDDVSQNTGLSVRCIKD